jgi:hypothetical protein
MVEESAFQNAGGDATIGMNEEGGVAEGMVARPGQDNEDDYMRPPPPLENSPLPAHPPPSYEAALIDEALEDIQQIRNNPTTVIDIMYGKELPQYLNTLKTTLTNSDPSLEQIETALNTSIQECFTAVNDHARIVDSGGSREISEATSFAVELAQLTELGRQEGSFTPNTPTALIVNMLEMWTGSNWISGFAENACIKLLLSYQKENLSNTSLNAPKPPPLVTLLINHLKAHGRKDSKRRNSAVEGKPPLKLQKVLEKMEVLLVHDFQERIALIMLSQWRALNEANTILFNSPAGLSSNRVTVSKTRTTSSNDNAECDDGAVRKPEELGKGMDGRCASKNVGGSTSGAGGDALPETRGWGPGSAPSGRRSRKSLLGLFGEGARVDRYNDHRKRSVSYTNRSLSQPPKASAPSRVRPENEKGGSWYALRPPDSTNVLFKTLGPKGANAALAAGAQLFAVQAPTPQHKSTWQLECNVLGGQQIIWEYHAFPPTSVQFALSFSQSKTSTFEVFPPTMSANAPNAGSLQRAEGGTYTFTWSSRVNFGLADIWCAVRCPGLDDQVQRRQFVRASRPVVISHAFSRSLYLNAIGTSNRAGFSKEASEIRLWKRFLGNEIITGESPVMVESDGKFLSVANAPKLLFSSSRSEDAALFYVRGLHPEEQLEMGMRFELGTVTKDASYVMCTTVEKNGNDAGCFLTLVKETKQGGENRPFEKAPKMYFYATPPAEAQHGARKVEGPAREGGARIGENGVLNATNDSSWYLSSDSSLVEPMSGREWLERAEIFGVLDTSVSSLNGTDQREKEWTEKVLQAETLMDAAYFTDVVCDWKRLSMTAKINQIVAYIAGTDSSGGGGSSTRGPPGVSDDLALPQLQRERICHVLMNFSILTVELEIDPETLSERLRTEIEKCVGEDLAETSLFPTGGGQKGDGTLADRSEEIVQSESNQGAVTGDPNVNGADDVLDKAPTKPVEPKVVAHNESILIWQDKIESLANQFALYDKSLYHKFSAKLSLAPSAVSADLSLAHTVPKCALHKDEQMRVSWLQNAILQEETPQIRAAALELVIGLAIESRKIDNYKQLLCCAIALESTPILRLSNSWGYVREKFHTEFGMLRVLCSRYGNYRSLRRIMVKKINVLPAYAPLKKASNHVALLPSLAALEDEDGGVKINWHKFQLMYDLFAQQYLPSSTTFESLSPRVYRLQHVETLPPYQMGRGRSKELARGKPENVLDISRLFTATPTSAQLLLERSWSLEGSVTGAINDKKSGGLGIPYRTKRSFFGLGIDKGNQPIVNIVVEDLLREKFSAEISQFHASFSHIFRQSNSDPEKLMTRTCEIIGVLCNEVMSISACEFFEEGADGATSGLMLKVKRSVRTVVLGAVGLRLWAAVQRANFDLDDARNQIVNKIREDMDDRSLWALCTDAKNDEHAMDFVGAWSAAVVSLDCSDHASGPGEKMFFLRNVFQEINRMSRQAQLKPLTADDLMPIVLFVVCRSKTPSLWATLRYVEPLVAGDRGEHRGYDQFCLANLEMALTICAAFPNFYKERKPSIN